MYNNKKSRFIKEQEANGFLSELGIRTPLSKIPLMGEITIKTGVYKMIKIKKSLLAEDQFIPEMFKTTQT